jgi:hypothetical protein
MKRTFTVMFSPRLAALREFPKPQNPNIQAASSVHQSFTRFVHCSLIAMETLEVEPHVLAGRRGVSFNLSRPTGTVECMVTIKALREYFWLEPDADDVRILRAFCNGYGRIRAIAERKVLAHPTAQLELTAGDFGRP